MHVKFIPFLLLLGLLGFTGCVSNNVEEILGACETADMSFTRNIEPIIARNCAVPGCHSGPSPIAGVDLIGYDNIKAKIDDGRIVARINDAGFPMPPSGVLPECDRLKIDAWVAAGALNN